MKPRIRFGTAGPEFAFKPDKRLRSSMDETVVLTPVEASREEEMAPQSRAETTPSITTEDEKLLFDAVRRARETRALPTETREYVPKIFAAILIGRNPESFGF